MTLRLVPPNQDENEEDLRTREEEYQEQVKRWSLHDLADFRRVQLYPDACQFVGDRCPGMMVRQYATTISICDVCGEWYVRNLEEEHEQAKAEDLRPPQGKQGVGEG